MQELLAETGKATRVGITGSPGVGKSTTIDALGTYLTGKGHKVAVLAVDPSSTRTGGSILGDKTRMARLANDERAFIRPSPAAGTLGGVAAKTRETMLICEAAGFDVILVETVGIGQSETAVADMTDFFLVLMLPGAGDELQGIKKGVVELADMIAVNKADGDNVKRARAAAGEYRAALHILNPALAQLGAAGYDLLGAYRRRHCGALGESAGAPPAAHRHGRIRRAPARAAGQVDVGDAGGSHPSAAEDGREAQGPPAGDREVGRERHALPRPCGRRDRGGAGHLDDRCPHHGLWALSRRAVQSEPAAGAGACEAAAPGFRRP